MSRSHHPLNNDTKQPRPIQQAWQSLTIPIRACKRRYLPLLMIYFAYGASTFITIADSFFVKEKLGFSATTIMSIGVWLSLPWTIKMVFGQFVDSIRVFHSNRLSYILIAASLMMLSSLLLAGLAGQWSWVIHLGTVHQLYLTAMLINVIGVVLQDVVADAMSVEVVERDHRSEKDITHDLAMVQLLGRISLSCALFLVAGLSGWLAQHLSYQTMYLLTLIIPCISISGCLLVKLEQTQTKPLKKNIFFGGMLFGGFIIGMGIFQVPYNQEWIFLVSLAAISYFLFSITQDVTKQTKRRIAIAAIVIFIFRAMPGVGPGLQWWQIDVLGFNKAFFGTLAQIGAGLAIVGMWILAKYVTEKSIAWIFIVLTLITSILSLPVLGMYYGLHHWTEATFGFGAHTIALVDTALASPFAQLSMIPMLTLIAVNAPKGNAATWFALMASLMNLALTAGSLLSKWMNHIWIVSREIKNSAGVITTAANYSHLGTLIWISLLAGLIIPIASIVILMRDDLARKKTSH